MFILRQFKKSNSEMIDKIYVIFNNNLQKNNSDNNNKSNFFTFKCNVKFYSLLVLVFSGILSSNIDLLAQIINSQSNNSQRNAKNDTSLVEYLQGPWQTRFNYGIMGAFGLNWHSADFKGLEGVKSCCPGYESGTGLNFGGSIFVNFPISDNLELSTRLGYTDLSGVLSREESTTILGSNGASAAGLFEHSIDAQLASVNLQVLASFRLTDEMRLSAGLRLGTLMTKTFIQKEQLLEPSNGVFTDALGNNLGRIRNQANGEIPNAAGIESALLFGGSYDLPMNAAHTLFLVPEVMVGYNVTSFISNYGWNAMTVNGGIGLRFAPRDIRPAKVKLPPPPPPPPPPLPPPPPPPVVPSLNATVVALSLDENNQEKPVSTIKVEEFLMNRTHPILPYIFFDDNSSSISNRYTRLTQKDKDEFSFKNFYKVKTMEVYYNVLNILGKRLQFYPQGNITLVGCNTDMDEERGNKALSQRRSEVVKDFLVREWGIDPRRITIEYRNLPEIPSNMKEQDGIEENRRVEMIANIPQLLEPVNVKDTLRISNPPRFRFKPQIFSNIGVKEWKVVTSQMDKDLKVFSGTGNPPTQIDWDVTQENEQEFVPRLDKPLQYRLVVVDNDNKVLESPKQTLPVQQLTIEKKIDEVMEDKEINKYAIIGFSFNKSELSGGNIEIAAGAKKSLRKSSTVLIKGFSDRIGNNDLNKKLATERAYSVADYLGVDRKNVRAVGEDILLYDNNLPEGRFYSRTVTIDIETPIE